MIKKVLLLTCLLGINQPNAGLLTETEMKQLKHWLENQSSTSAPKLSNCAIFNCPQHFNSSMQQHTKPHHAMNLLIQWKYYWLASIYNHIFTDEIRHLYTKAMIIKALSNHEEPCTKLHHVIGYVSSAYATLNNSMMGMIDHGNTIQHCIDYLKDTISTYWPEANLDHLHNLDEDNIKLYGTEHSHYFDLYALINRENMFYKQLLDNGLSDVGALLNTININILRTQFQKLGFAHSIIDTHSAYNKHKNQFNYAENTKQADQYILPSDLVSDDAASQEKIMQCAYEDIFNEQISPEFYAAVAEKIIAHYDYHIILPHLHVLDIITNITFNIPNHRDDIKALYYDTIKRKSYIAQTLYLSKDISHKNNKNCQILTRLLLDVPYTHCNQDISNLSIDEIMEKCKMAEIAELFDPRNFVDMMMQGSFEMHLGLFLIKPNFI